MLDFHAASPEEKREAFAQVHEIWPHADDPEVHLLRRLSAIQQSRAQWFVGTVKGQVVTSCGAYPLTLYGPNSVRKARGFGAVFTLPSHRGQGHAASMLRFVMDHFRSRSVDDFVLFSDINPLYYEKIGFHKLPSWSWEIAAQALRPEASWSLVRTPVLAEDPGTVGCAFGLKRDREDNVWVLAKQQTGRLRKTLVQDRHKKTLYWILSHKLGRTYTFLESNIPQDRHHWDLFHVLIAADCAKARCRVAKGWWTGSGALPGPEIRSRHGEVLMWTSGQGDLDPWLPDIKEKGFRIFETEHF